MTTLPRGAIDCDVHPAVPATSALLPYLDEYWREHFTVRGLDRGNFDMTCYPPGAALCGRPDWRPKQGKPGSDFEMLKTQALDAFGTRYAICNPIFGASTVYSEDLGAVLCRAVNDWIAHEWLDRDPRLRASILVPTQNPELAAEEIERCAGDSRFVQVLMLAMEDMPLGKRHYWPIYRAAERHDLPIGIHAGSTYRHAPTTSGWPSYYLEDYVSFAQAFGAQLLSLVAEGVFTKHPKLKVVLIESGVTWLPGFLWHADKTWRGIRMEVPWVTRPPSEIIREHVRVTIQPVDAPPRPDQLERVLEQIGSDKVLLFSTDYPHWHYEGEDALPPAMSGALAQRILIDNPLETYSRLRPGPAVSKEGVP